MDKLVELQHSLYRQLRYARSNGETENIESIKAEIAKVEDEIAIFVFRQNFCINF